MAKINASFLSAAMKAQFNGGSWSKVGEPVSLQDIWAQTMPGVWDEIDGDKAQVIAKTFDSGDVALRIAVPIKGGSVIELKLSSNTDLEEDDYVSINSITGQLLRKPGYEDIVKFDADLYEEPEEEEQVEEKPVPKARSTKKK